MQTTIFIRMMKLFVSIEIDEINKINEDEIQIIHLNTLIQKRMMLELIVKCMQCETKNQGLGKT